MPIPSSINDLSTTAGSNSPGGTEDTGTADNYLRVYASYIAALRDVVMSGTASVSTLNFAYTGTLTGGTGVVNIGASQIHKDAAGNIGFGIVPPRRFTVYTAGAAVSVAHFVNTATGPAELNGTIVGVDSVGSGYFMNQQATPLIIGNSNVERWRIGTDGSIITALRTTPPTLTADDTMVAVLESPTSLRFYVRAGGVTRSAALTLA